LVRWFSCVTPRWFLAYNGWLRIITYAFLIVYIAASVSTLLVVLAVYTARTIKISRITISFSRIRVFTARYAPSIMCRFLFYNISSFLSIVLWAVSILYGVYHTDTPNVITCLIIKEYTNFIILKFAPYINIKIRLITKLYIINFFFILIIYSPYFSLESIYILSILIWFIVIFSVLPILIVVYKLKSLGFLVKYISSYFFGVNFILYIFNYFLYSLWIFLSIL